MDYLALKLSEQLMAERRAEARRHSLARRARGERVRPVRQLDVGRLLSRLAVRPARARETR